MKRTREDSAASLNLASPHPGPSHIGQFEAATRGIGRKLLGKWGWKGGGLGRHEEGRLEPVQAHVRAEPQRGLGSADTELTQNLLHRKITHTDIDDLIRSQSTSLENPRQGRARSFPPSSPQPASHPSRPSSNQNRSNAPHKAAELPSYPSIQNENVVIVLDLTPEEEAAQERRVLALSQSRTLSAQAVTLLHSHFINLHRTVVGRMKSFAFPLVVPDEVSSSTLLLLSSAEVQLGPDSPHLAPLLQDLPSENPLLLIHELNSFISSFLSELTSTQLPPEESFLPLLLSADSARRKFGRLLFDSGLNLLIMDVLASSCCDQMNSWKFDLTASGRVREAAANLQTVALSEIKVALRPFLDIHVADLWSFLQENLPISILRTWIEPTWAPGNSDRAVVELLEDWREVAPVERLVETFLIPRLSEFFEDWDPSSTPIELIRFISVYFGSPIINEEQLVLMLFHPIRRLLEPSFSPEDISVVSFLLEFNKISSECVQMIVELLIGPKLVTYFQAEMKVDPSDQDLHPLLVVLKWRPLLGESVLLDLLESHLFPQWIDALSLWLDHPPPKTNPAERGQMWSEVRRWYLGWKRLFETEDLISYPSVILNMERALHIISVHVD